MNDLIDRQAAIDAVENLVSSMSVCISIDECHGMRDMKYRALKAISALPSAQPEQQWIPCSERLPEKSGEYLVSGKWGDDKVSVGHCEYLVEDGYFSTAWNFDVLAWMPLPEPWKGEQL